MIEELDQVFQGEDRPVTMRDLGELKYLERVIKESLRLYPSAPTVMRTLTEDIEIGNTSQIPTNSATTLKPLYPLQMVSHCQPVVE